MSAYLLADVEWHNEEKHQEYVAKFGGTLTMFGGHVLAGDPAPKTLEGPWKTHTLVIIEFPDMETLDRWYESPVYAPLLALRLKAATTRVLALNGV
ncbi:MAG: DUF1330 domain-containing protein [Thermoplasmata archaeon]